jgi:hypothetical protein
MEAVASLRAVEVVSTKGIDVNGDDSKTGMQWLGGMIWGGKTEGGGLLYEQNTPLQTLLA